MKEQNTENKSEQSIMIEDLNADNAEEIKGGPKKIFIGGLSATDQNNEAMPQTREHILLARQ